MKKNNSDNNGSYGIVLKYISLFGGVQSLNILIGLARNKVVAVLLGPAGMGLSALFNTALTFVSQATNLGISFSAVKHVSELADKGDEAATGHFVSVVRAWTLLVAVVGMAACLLLCRVLSVALFSTADHTLHFALLSPVVAMTAVTGGETAILKGRRQLRSLAATQVWAMAAGLVVSVPIYWVAGLSGVVPVIIVSGLLTMLVTLRCSLRLYPLRLNGVRHLLGEGRDMVRLGVAFILSGVATSGAEMAVRAFMSYTADVDTVGLYNAAYIMTVSYAGMVFAAMETDFFPRLSAVNADRAAVNLAVNRQIEVSLLVISPMLSLLILALPLLVPLLYSGKFAAVVPMARLAAVGMYLRAATLPMAYILLAKGRSVEFLVMEITSAAVFVLLVTCGFSLWGLSGAGFALMLNEAVYFVMVIVFTALRYGFRPSRQAMICAAVQLPLGIAVYAATSSAATSLTLGLPLVAVSAAVSVRMMYERVRL